MFDDLLRECHQAPGHLADDTREFVRRLCSNIDSENARAISGGDGDIVMDPSPTRVVFEPETL
jgi:hypothetical protein